MDSIWKKAKQNSLKNRESRAIQADTVSQELRTGSVCQTAEAADSGQLMQSGRSTLWSIAPIVPQILGHRLNAARVCAVEVSY